MNNIETAIEVLTSSYGVKVLAVVAASAAVAIYKFGTNIVTTIAAAIAAAESGADVTLVESYGFVGGLASSALVGTICGLY